MRWFDIAEELLPPVYKAIKDMYAYAKSLNTEFLNWVSYLERILNNFFIQRCSVQTLEYWEDLLDISLNGDETIEERRIKVLEYLNNIYPTSEPYVRSVIERMFPEEEYHLWFNVENNNPFDLNIDIFTTNTTELNKFKEWMRKMCPAHLLQIIAKAERVEIERPFIVNNGIMEATVANLGVVSFVIPPEPPAPDGGWKIIAIDLVTGEDSVAVAPQIDTIDLS